MYIHMTIRPSIYSTTDIRQMEWGRKGIHTQFCNKGILQNIYAYSYNVKTICYAIDNKATSWQTVNDATPYYCKEHIVYVYIFL